MEKNQIKKKKIIGNKKNEKEKGKEKEKEKDKEIKN